MVSKIFLEQAEVYLDYATRRNSTLEISPAFFPLSTYMIINIVAIFIIFISIVITFIKCVAI